MLPGMHMVELPQGIYLGVSLFDAKYDHVQLFQKFPICFPMWLDSLYPHISVRNVSFFSHLCQNLILLDMLIFVAVMTVKLYLTVFICLSPTIVSLNIFQVCVAYSHCLCEIPICLAYFLLAYFDYLFLIALWDLFKYYQQ